MPPLAAKTIIINNLAGNVNPAVSIPLSNGFVALVDAQDASLVSGFVWRAHKSYLPKSIEQQVYYAVAGRKPCITMHRLILGWPPGLVDHIDHDGLNNQRANLRLASPRENSAHSRRERGVSGYRGVWENGSKWSAYIRDHGKRKYLGSFDLAEDAAWCWDQAAKRIHGPYAILNFPEDRP